MEKGETLSITVTPSDWPGKVKALLDSYLCEFGLDSEATRVHWINRVVDDLTTRTELVATEDILEEAVLQMRDLIEARIAMISGHDPARERKEIAQIMVVLLHEKNKDCLNKLFDPSEADLDLNTLEHLRHACDTALPVLLPEEAPLAMPVQAIELRSLNPLRRLFGRTT